ncbi:MAG: hypothetical protein ACQESF_00255 [Nanobdellota archaeon]
MNKKGVAEPIVDIFMFFTVVLLFVVFGFIFSFMTENHVFKFQENKGSLDARIELLQLLRTPISLDGYKTDYAGYIALAYNDKDLQDRLNDDLDKLLEKFVKKTKADAARLLISDYKISSIGRTQMSITYGNFEKNIDAPSKIAQSVERHVSIIKIPGFKDEKIVLSFELKNEK